MLERIDRILNIIAGTMVGLMIGDGIYSYGDYRIHPEIYKYYSAPWYTGVLLYGILTAACLLIVLILKRIIRMIKKRGEQ